MSDIATVVAAARTVWRFVKSVPVLGKWLLRRNFSPDVCRKKIRVELSGTNASFELRQDRPSFGMTGLMVQIYNPLPFDVELVFDRLSASVDSSNFLSGILSSRQVVPGAGFAYLSLPEMTLTQQQATWVKELSRQYARVQFSLRWLAKSSINDWEGAGQYEFPVFIRTEWRPRLEK